MKKTKKKGSELKPLPLAKSDEEIYSLLSASKPFKIGTRAVTCSNFSIQLLKKLMAAVSISEGVEELIVQRDMEHRYYDSHLKMILDAIRESKKITKLTLMDLKPDDNAATIISDIFQHIKKFGFVLDSNLMLEVANILAAGLKTCNIKSLCLSSQAEISNIQPILDAIPEMKNLKSLEVVACEPYTSNVLSGVRNHQSLRKLQVICHKQTLNEIVNVIKYNTLITKLHIVALEGTFKSAELDEILIPALKENKTITSLKLWMSMPIEHQICELLLDNTTLKHLGIGPELTKEVQELSNALKKNTTLTSLDIKNHLLNSKGFVNLGEMFRINQTLREFVMTKDSKLQRNSAAKLFEGIADNESLTSLKIFYFTELDQLTNMLQTNKSLTRIECGTDTRADHAEILKRNKTQQEITSSNILFFVGMLARSQDAFFRILPMELWLMILKKIRVPGVTIEFDKALIDSMRRYESK